MYFILQKRMASCPKRCQVNVKWSFHFFANLQKSEEFALCFPIVKYPFIHCSSHLFLCYSFLCLLSSQPLPPLSCPLQGNYLPAHGRTQWKQTLQQWVSVSEYVRIKSSFKLEVNWDSQEYSMCEIVEYLSNQDCFTTSDCFLFSRKDLLIISIKT